MINHLTITVIDYQKSVDFYTASLATIGIVPLFADDNVVTGFGLNRPMFWVGVADEAHQPSKNVHIAFTAKSHAEVDEWHKVAIENGGVDNGVPGIRLEYHDDYYAAFVIDQDGNNVEVVCGND